MTVDPRALRDAFGCFATGITVITTADAEGTLYGVTANSFTSLSLDPPLCLFCLDYNAMSFEAFQNSRHFAVNVLCEDQEGISTNFARSQPDKWNGIDYSIWQTGSPILPGCLANLECDTHAIHEGGDHVIVVGRIREMAYREDDCRPLLYYKGRYNALSDGETVNASPTSSPAG